MTERQADSLLRVDLWEFFEVFKDCVKDTLLLTLPSCNVVSLACRATISTTKVSYFVRLNKGIGTATKSAYPFATTKSKVL